METSQLLFENQLITTLIFSRSSDSISTNLENETIILDISKGLYSCLDAVGTTIWDILARPSTFQQIADQIVSEYNVEKEQCAQDLLFFLKELKDNSLIVVNINEKTD